MDGLQAPAIGEGMSDGLAIIMYDNDVVGEYSYSNAGGIRTEPYDTWDTTGRVYDENDWVGEVHDDGEIYAAIIWDMWKRYRGSSPTELGGHVW